VRDVAEALRAVSATRPAALVVLGSGLSGVVDEMDVTATMPFAEVPHMPAAKVEGHAGRFVWGEVAGRPVLVMQGRVHFYEGHPISTVVLGVRAARLLGCETLIVTNAAGGVSPRLKPGDIVLLQDHINLMFTNPLIGANIDEFGPRFPPMVDAYAPELRDVARRVAAGLGATIEEGVYAALSGPAFETPAEVAMLRTLGADIVGMSTVPEVIAAVHAGMRVLGFSLVTNMAAGSAHGHQEVLQTAAERAPLLSRIITGVLAEL
jgi:purine-nucleoside phosphorylase